MRIRVRVHVLWCVCVCVCFPRSLAACIAYFRVTSAICPVCLSLSLSASLKSTGRLKLTEDSERENMQVLVVDSHRPFHLNNIYLDGEDKTGNVVEAGDIDKGMYIYIYVHIYICVYIYIYIHIYISIYIYIYIYIYI